jgi:predicted DNA-binding transcriptional regulator AlpA
VKILRNAERARRLGCSRWTERRIAVSDPSYPQEIEISPGIRGIPEAEFEAWLQSRPRVTRTKGDATPLERVIDAGRAAWAPPAKPEPLHDAHVREYKRAKGKRAAKGAK